MANESVSVDDVFDLLCLDSLNALVLSRNWIVRSDIVKWAEEYKRTNIPYMARGAKGTALLHPTRNMEPPQSNPSISRTQASASFRFMY